MRPAGQTPALVLGSWHGCSNYHVSKLERLRAIFPTCATRWPAAIGPVIPTVLHPEQQAYFALGYYQMCAQMEKDRLARKTATTAAKAEDEQGGM